MIVVCDATVLIGLSMINKAELLQGLFGKIFIPETVFQEVAVRGGGKPGSDIVKNAPWIEKIPVTDTIQTRFLMTSLDQGEAEVLVLAREIGADLVLLDEEKARKSATMAG